MRLLILFSTFCIQAQTAEQLVKELASDKTEQRDQAAQALLKLGKEALPSLQKAASQADLEVAQRARAIIKVLDPRDSREALENINERLAKAKTIKVVFRGGTTFRPKDIIEDQTTVFTGEIFLKVGGKAYCSSSRHAAGYKSGAESFLVCDGSTVLLGRVVTSTLPAPAGLREALEMALVRMGLCATATFGGYIVDILRGDTNFENFASTLQLADYAGLEDDGKFRVLAYTLKGTTYGMAGKVRVWYDPSTYRPIKRLIEIGSSNTRITESYEEFTLDGEIPDEKFKIPTESKQDR